MRAGKIYAGIILIGLFSAGCGGEAERDPSASTGTTAVSAPKAQFIKEADAVCARAGKQTEQEYAAFLKAHKVPEGIQPPSAQFDQVVETILIPALRRQVEEIKDLEAPEADEALIAEFLDAVEAATRKAERNPAAGRSPEKLLADADRLIKDYGFKVCGQR